jgi:PKD repeat protein
MKAKLLLYRLAFLVGIFALLPAKTNAQCTNFAANFTIAIDSSNCKKIVVTNQSTETNNSTSYKWVFGDSSQTTTGKDADHIYQTNNTFTVCLYITKTVNNDICRDSICKDVVINCNTCKVEANFTFKSDSSNCKKIWFTNTSGQTNNNTTYTWTFGDNTTSHDKNIGHTYGDSNTYTVCLKAEKTDGNAMCADSICKQVIVCPPTNTCKVEAGFTFKADSSNCKKIWFTNTSGQTNNNTTYTWKFGDKTTSHDKNSSHEYSIADNYPVCLVVTKTDGNAVCKDSICKTVTINCDTGCNIKAYFGFVRDSADCKKIHFSNLSVGMNNTTQVGWRFDDGTYSADRNVTHTYNDTGRYTVCMRVIKTDGNKVCSDSFCKPVHVECVNCIVNAEFTYRPDSGDCKRIFFKPNTASTGAKFKWTFGDGTSSTNYDPGHNYNSPGRYKICLVITKIENNRVCTDSFCREISVCKTTSVEEINTNTDWLTAYPNPFTNNITVAINNAAEFEMSITVTDMLGKTMVKETLAAGTQTATLNTVNLPKGIYMIELHNNAQFVQRIKVVK